MTTWFRITAVIGAELRLRIRDASFPLMTVSLLSVCALMVPAPTASYTTITVNARRLLMSADASLTAAAVVMSIVLLPLFALVFDVGHVRDAADGIDALHLTSPVRGSVIAAGRLLANAAAMLAVVLLALLTLSSTLHARSLGTPSRSAVVIFLLIVLPVGVSAVLLGALLDRSLGARPGLRSAAAFAVWFAAMLASATGGRDLFGVSYLRQVIVPDGHPTSLSVGMVATHGLDVMLWTVTPLTHALIVDRARLTVALAIAAALAATVIRFRISPARSAGAAVDGDWATMDTPPTSSSFVLSPVRSTPRGAPVPMTAWVVVTRWLARSRMLAALILLTFILAIRSGAATSAAFAAALVVPALAVSKTSKREVRVAATLEATTSALLRPTAWLTYAWMLAFLAIVPMLPALARTPLVQGATAVCGVIAITSWLTWTHRCAERPLLGTSTFAALWYLSVFNHPAASLDVFGLWGANVWALGASLAAASVMVVLVLRHERI